MPLMGMVVELMTSYTSNLSRSRLGLILSVIMIGPSEYTGMASEGRDLFQPPMKAG